jgi:LysR family nitrogen assimilation transcriptional regulator
MNLKQLEYFIHVAELGGFSRAAKLLGIVQPALSKQVRKLEHELGQHLLVRDGRGVRLTEAGARLLAHGRGIVHQVARATDDLSNIRGAPVGRIAIGMSSTVTRLLAVPLVTKFRSKFPNASLRIVEGLSNHLQEWLINGRIDIALLYNMPPSPELRSFPLLKENLFLITARQRMSNRAAVELRHLSSYPLILPARPNAIRVQVDGQLAKIGKSPTVVMEIDAIPAILELVAENYGATVLAANSIRASGVKSQLIARPIIRPRLSCHLSATVSDRRHSTALQLSTLSLIQELATHVLAQDRA